MTPSDVHPSHDVREEGILVSDPICQVCRIGVHSQLSEKLREPCRAYYSGYTLDDLDNAIANSIGPAAWAANGSSSPGFCRPILMNNAAQARWWAKMPADEDERILRLAMADLASDGCLKPVGGWGDDEGKKEPWE